MKRRPNTFCGLVMAFVLWAMAPTPAQALEAASDWFDTEFASIRLISATTGAEAVGADGALQFGLEFQLQEDWKIYWRSPGDAGFPPRPEWSDSKNIQSTEWRWPTPVRFSVLGLETLGYKNSVVFPISVTPSQTGGPVRLGGRISYLICSDICIPETMTVALDLPGGEGRPSSFAHLINKFQARVPKQEGGKGVGIDSLSLLETPEGGQEILVAARTTPGMPFDSPDVFLEGPLDNPGSVGFGQPVIDTSRTGDRAQFRVPVTGLEKFTKDLPGKTFIATLVDGNRTVEFSGPATPVTAPPSLSADYGRDSTLGIILVLAFLGGLVLNLMPCVLPVLSLKVLGVIGHGGGEHRMVRQGFVASAAGIVTSFMILAVALAALKSTGTAVGWGIQFQHPWFLTLMALIISIFACNLWGWFDFRVPGLASNTARAAPAHGPGGHFMAGMLATLLATPCSAPFLGTAVGFALARGTAEILLIFGVLGLGLAAPYLLIAAFPALATALPRPGLWMVRLQRFLGLLLAGTAAWLVWVLSVQAGIPSAAIVGFCILFLGGAICLQVNRANRRRLATAGATLCIIVALAAPYTLAQGAGNHNHIASPLPDSRWHPFDQSVIRQQTSHGNLVFVDVTAEWCVTCQVNKAFVLEDSSVLELLMADDLTTMQADWTLPDDAITQYLSSFGKYGVPFNVVYGPGAPDGLVLPEILTIESVTQAIEDARG